MPGRSRSQSGHRARAAHRAWGGHRRHRGQGTRGLPDRAGREDPVRRSGSGGGGSLEALSLEQVLKDLGGTVRGPVGFPEFTSVSTDSRSVAPGALFFALMGPRFDGHRFVVEARRRGARGAVVQDPSTARVDASFPLIVVPDTRRALLDLATEYRARQRATVVGITGSNGKT